MAALEWQAREFDKPDRHRRDHALPRRADARAGAGPRHRPVPHRSGSADQYRQACQRATQVTLTLRLDDSHLTLAIGDNGRGIDPADRVKPDSFGLRGMHERASALGGTLALSPAPGGGTMVTIKIRLAPPVAPAQNKKQDE